MNVKETLDEIEQLSRFNGRTLPDRFTMRGWLSSELNELSGKVEADFFYVHLDPVVMTVEGQRTYNLPDNFGINFVRYAGQAFGRTTSRGMDQYVCKIDDGTNETIIEYENPVQFYSRNLRVETNAKPSIYTIVSAPNGRKQIALSPPPDDNSDANYTLDGLYLPTDWKLKDFDQMPPLPGNSPILKFGVLRRIDPSYEAQYQSAFNTLMFNVAKAQGSMIVPVLGRYGRNEYEV